MVKIPFVTSRVLQATAPVEITGSLGTLGIVQFTEADGTPAVQLPAFAQAVEASPVQVVVLAPMTEVLPVLNGAGVAPDRE